MASTYIRCGPRHFWYFLKVISSRNLDPGFHRTYTGRCKTNNTYNIISIAHDALSNCRTISPYVMLDCTLRAYKYIASAKCVRTAYTQVSGVVGAT